MSREELIKKIEEEIEKEMIYDLDKDFICNKYENSKNGIYLLYNGNGIIIYVGKFGDGGSTSFYHRMYKHGDGAHCNKSWFNEVKQFKVKEFPKLNNKELSQVERLMIYAKGQPKFNDSYITEDEYELLASKL